MLHALVAHVRLLAGVGNHMDGHLGIVGKTLARQHTRPALGAALSPNKVLGVAERLTAVQALGRAVVRGRRSQGLLAGRSEEGVMAVHRQWALPFSVDAQDPQLSVVTGHAGGARGVHMQIL